MYEPFFFLSPLQRLHVQLMLLSTLLVRHNLCNAPNQKRLFPIHDNCSIPTYLPIFQTLFFSPCNHRKQQSVCRGRRSLRNLSLHGCYASTLWVLCTLDVKPFPSDHLLAPFYQRSNGVEDYRSSFSQLCFRGCLRMRHVG